MNPSASHPSEEMYCPGCEHTFYGVEFCPNDGAKLVRLISQPDQLLGRTFDGRYTIVEKLGEGGMGSVYRSRQHSFGREVAIKVVNPGLVTDPMIIKRFLREAKLSSRLSHPNAVAVLDFGQTDDGIFYLVMELVNGRTLHDAMSQTPQFTPERVVRVGTQICDALECAHDLGIVHRDLKPSNVMLLTSGRDLVKVLDFGLAKSLAVDDRGTTMTGTRGGLMGTPAFVAPELALGRACDHRADLYSLGCILYLIGSGWPPFSAENGAELISKHAYEQPTPMPNAPAALAAVVMRLLAKNPQDRFSSAAETRQALEDSLAMPQAASSVSLPAVAAGSWPRAERATSMQMPVTGEEAPLMLTDDVTSVSVRAESPTRIVHQRRQGRLLPALTTLLLLALGGLGGAYWWSRRTSANQAPPSGGGGIRVQQIFPDGGPASAAILTPADVAPAGEHGAAVVPVDAAPATADAESEALGDDPSEGEPTEQGSSVTVEVSKPTIIDPIAKPSRSRSSRRRRRGEDAATATAVEAGAVDAGDPPDGSTPPAASVDATVATPPVAPVHPAVEDGSAEPPAAPPSSKPKVEAAKAPAKAPAKDVAKDLAKDATTEPAKDAASAAGSERAAEKVAAPAAEPTNQP